MRCGLGCQGPRSSYLLALMCHVQGHSGSKPKENNEQGSSPGSVFGLAMETDILAIQVIFLSSHQRRGDIKESISKSRIRVGIPIRCFGGVEIGVQRL